MEGSFIPECYFDTVLVRAVLQTDKVLNHKKGCNNVMKAMREGRLRDAFAVGIVDKDKKDLDYLEEFDAYGFDKLVLFKHKNKHHFVIQLNPPIEKWIIEVSDEANLDLSHFGLPREIERLKKITKGDSAKETKELKDLCRELVKSNSLTIRRFVSWIKYLKENTLKTDINRLING